MPAALRVAACWGKGTNLKPGEWAFVDRSIGAQPTIELTPSCSPLLSIVTTCAVDSACIL